MFRKNLTALGVVVMLAVLGSSALALSPDDKCVSAKQRAAGKKLKAKLTCYGKAKARNVAVDESCLARAEAKFVGAVAAGDAKGMCNGTAASLEAIVDGCIDTLLADLPGNGRCQATSTKAVGKANFCELTCASKDVFFPGFLANCHLRCDARLNLTIGKAGPCGDAVMIMDHVHTCRDTLIGAF